MSETIEIVPIAPEHESALIKYDYTKESITALITDFSEKAKTLSIHGAELK